MIINARSPFIIEVNELLQIGSKIEIFIWNNPSLQPVLPSYTLSKGISASNNLSTTYNISPFISEFISFTDASTVSVVNDTNVNQYCNVLVKRYSYDGSYTLLDSTQYLAFYSFGTYGEGFNYDSGIIRALEGTYYYDLPTAEAGHITVVTATDYKVRYTNLDDLTTNTAALPDDSILNIPKVKSFIFSDNYVEGNLVEILNDVDAVIWSATFKPKEACKYTPVQCDYINSFGAWNRIWFYAKSSSKFKTENKEYNLLQNQLINYDIQEGQRKTFNANGKVTIEVNTDWVDEYYKEIIKELMLSERILINEQPATLSTKDTELFKHINTNLINYKLEFEFAFDYINTVV